MSEVGATGRGRGAWFVVLLIVFCGLFTPSVMGGLFDSLCQNVKSMIVS